MPKVVVDVEIEPGLLNHMLGNVVRTKNGFRCGYCFKDVQRFTLHHDADGNTRNTSIHWICEGGERHAG